MTVYMVFDSDAEPGVPICAFVSEKRAVHYAQLYRKEVGGRDEYTHEKDTEWAYYYGCDECVHVRDVGVVE